MGEIEAVDGIVHSIIGRAPRTRGDILGAFESLWGLSEDHWRGDLVRCGAHRRFAPERGRLTASAEERCAEDPMQIPWFGVGLLQQACDD